LTFIKQIPPGLVVATVAVLVLSQLCFAVLPYKRRAYLPILLMTTIGFGLGQANMVPAVPFALLLQPLARFVPRPGRQPQEPKPGNSSSAN